MRIKEREGNALMMLIGPIVFFIGLFKLSINPILAGLGIFFVGYIREQQIKKGR